MFQPGLVIGHRVVVSREGRRGELDDVELLNPTPLAIRERHSCFCAHARIARTQRRTGLVFEEAEHAIAFPPTWHAPLQRLTGACAGDMIAYRLGPAARNRT